MGAPGEIILHGNPRSMYSEKVRRVLAYKSLDWSDVEVPALPPKTDLIPLTGGYRRMPVMQIGADIYCDSALIIERLEQLAPDPTVFPAHLAGAARMIADWVDHRVARWAILSVFVDMLPHLPEPFIKDRTELIADFAPDRVRALAPNAFEQFGQFLGFVDTALASAPWIAGDAFSVADAACYHVINFARTNPRVAAPVDARPRVVEWIARVGGFAAPTVTPRSGAYALDAARDASPVDLGDTADGAGTFALGQRVTVGADDYAIERMEGTIVRLSPTAIGIARTTDLLGETVLHVPRLGFSVEILA